MNDLAETMKREIYLREHSPQHNPIKPLWGELNTALSRVLVADMSQLLIQNTFNQLSPKGREAREWIDTSLSGSGRLWK
jgi:hypothetical protein